MSYTNNEFPDDDDLYDDDEKIIINNNDNELDISALFGECVLEYPLLDNFTIETYKAKLPLAFFFEKLSINRKLIKKHWKQIYKAQKKNLIEGYPVYFSGIITVCLWNDKLYVIDGQHRTRSMKELYNKFNNNNTHKKQLEKINFRLDLIRVKEYEEMIDIIYEINTVVQLDVEALQLQAKNNIRKYFNDKFKSGKQSILSPAVKSIRPKNK
jgi:hypothetical protein